MQIKKPILMTLAIIVCLTMVRLGFWQLDRAEQKRSILSQSQALSELPPVNILSLEDQFNSDASQLRFRQVNATGNYLSEESILVDNQVFASKVGYALITPFKLHNSDLVVLVDRGWLSVGESRDILPEVETSTELQSLSGRLNLPYAQPPIWSDEYSVVEGAVWQFLPIHLFRQQTGLDALPLVLELAPIQQGDSSSPILQINRQSISDEWVYKHHAYALQWFSMALVFFIACLVVLIKSLRKQNDD